MATAASPIRWCIAREIVHERAAATITVTDGLQALAAHRVEMFWHFGPDCSTTMLGEGVRIVSAPVILTLTWPAGLKAQLVRGDADLASGMAVAPIR